MTAFLDLGLAEPIARAISDEQYETPTPIQSQTIPQVLAGRDVVGIAQTGTGKTAAFALPILNHLAGARTRPEKRSCRVLVLSPTRELSAQIVDSFRTYGRYVKPTVALAIGGVNINPQMRSLANGVDILVATPGRLLDLMQHRAVLLDKIEVFVLDEADRMLDMGFIHDIRRIVGKLPAKRQTLFFSATMPKEIADLAGQMARDPVHVAVTPAATTVERIAQRVVHVERSAKAGLLAEIIRTETVDRMLVFTRTKHGADKVVRQLSQANLNSAAIHGNKSQNQRERVLAAFRAGSIRTLVATDIAARGIDVEGVSHVINFDLPNIPESYVHRIGRTARAGAEGVAISFCDREERAFLRDIEKLIRMSIPASGEPLPAGQADADGERPKQGRPQRRRGGRNSPARDDNHRAPRQQQGQPNQSRDSRRDQLAQDQDQPRHAQPRQQQPRQDQPHQGRPKQNNSSKHGHRQGGHGGGDRSRPAEGGRQQRSTEGGRPAGARASNDGAIGTLAFMQPTRRNNHPNHRDGARRAPR